MLATTVAIMGSTGSIGTQTLEIIQEHPDEFEVVALGAAKSLELLVEQAIKYKPQVVAISDSALEKELRQKLPSHIDVISGPDALANASSISDVVINGVVGFAGLPITIATLKAGKRLGLANKESLIAAGPLIQNFRATKGAELIPVDSEHCAIHQCLGLNPKQEDIKRIVLTASGGPFLNTPINELASKTPEQACKHPKWKMGRKISVDSATMMNKGLEIIEASWLFNIDPDSINVVIHPQSIIHSLVEYKDGSVLAQLGNPDMRIPISFGLSWPERIETDVKRLDLFDIAQFDFKRPENDRFPCLMLAREAIIQGGTSSTILNAANEVAVNEFLNKKI